MGAITRKRLFGGAVLYCDSFVFAILAFDAVWFRADAESDAWDAIAAERFSAVWEGGSTKSINYRRAPDDGYDDAEAIPQMGAAGPRGKLARDGEEEGAGCVSHQSAVSLSTMPEPIASAVAKPAAPEGLRPAYRERSRSRDPATARPGLIPHAPPAQCRRLRTRYRITSR